MNMITIEELDNFTFKSISEAWVSDYSLDTTSITYVPTELEIYKRENKGLWEDLTKAENELRLGDVPNATKDVADDFNSKIHIYGRKPVEVIDEFLCEHSFKGVTS